MRGELRLTAAHAVWVFDFETIRILPGQSAHVLLRTLGEVVVPLRAIASVGFAPTRNGGKLRLVLRVGADPLTQVTAGLLPERADPFQVTVNSDTAGAADQLAGSISDALAIADIPSGPTSTYLVPAPAVPLSAEGEDGTASFDGKRVTIEWGWSAPSAKRASGPRSLDLATIERVEWNSELLRFRSRGEAAFDPTHDTNAMRLWGMGKNVTRAALLAAAVTAHLPHPHAPSTPAADHDVVLRRLRELGDLRRDGVLTEEEFTVAKQALLRAM